MYNNRTRRVQQRGTYKTSRVMVTVSSTLIFLNVIEILSSVVENCRYSKSRGNCVRLLACFLYVVMCEYHILDKLKYKLHST